MLKSTIAPMLLTLHSKTKSNTILPFKTPIFCTLLPQSPPSVRRNASTNPLTIETPETPSYKLPPASAYIHLPFCRKRCHYCDFPIVALGSTSPETADDDPRILNYINTLIREIEATQTHFDPHPPLQTVFFGGGTPSLVPPRLVAKVLDTLRSRFGICLDAEISMEMDPGTFDDRKLKDLMGLGVNRVSLGVQAFQEELLKACGRAHGVKEVHEAIEIIGSCGVGNWSMDLISSLPNQTQEMWEESLRLTVEAQPNHVSVYDLQIEKDTKFGSLYTPGEFPLPSDTQSAKFYRMASRTLGEANYNHYEVSSYSKSSFECKHNYTYWINKPFYAFGLGSASYINGTRYSRPKKLKDYTNYVKNLEDGLVDLGEEDDVDEGEMAMDIVMLSFRTSKGLEFKSFVEDFGSEVAVELCKVYEPYMKSGHVLFLDDQRREITEDEFSSLVLDDEKLENEIGFIRLSDPDGFLLSNELISLAFGVIDP
ncbi:putative coproporphyrinogen dehydrogenase [Helianthus annuus]|nr:putative coproporphyrinogen dehydrogenase [Helianthus annuus]